MYAVYGGSNGLKESGEGNHCGRSGWIIDSGMRHRPRQRRDDNNANYGRRQHDWHDPRDHDTVSGADYDALQHKSYQPHANADCQHPAADLC